MFYSFGITELCGSYTGGYPLYSKNFSFEKFNNNFLNFELKKKFFSIFSISAQILLTGPDLPKMPF